MPPGTNLGGTYETFYRQFVVNGGIESTWFHQYCRTASCVYFGNNGDIMDLTYLDQYNEAGFFRFRMSWDNGDSIEWSQERLHLKLISPPIKCWKNSFGSQQSNIFVTENMPLFF